MAASGGETLTTVIAVVGCGLSVYNTITARLDKRPKIKLLAEIGFLPTETNERLVLFRILNGGTSTIQINSVYILLPDKTVLALLHPFLGCVRPLPQNIESNRSDILWVEYKNVYDELVRRGLGRTPKLKAQVGDALGNKYRSKPLLLQPPDSFAPKQA